MLQTKSIQKTSIHPVQKKPIIKADSVHKLYWAKVKEGSEAIFPTKKNEDGGYDLYICSEKKEFLLRPGDVVLLPTGLASAFPKEFVGLFRERGSTGSKCLSLRMGILDSGYRNEIFIGINNTSNKTIVITDDAKSWEQKNLFFNVAHYVIYPYNKAIAQVIFVRLSDMEVNKEFITWEELQTMESERGLGSLGSSKK